MATAAQVPSDAWEAAEKRDARVAVRPALPVRILAVCVWRSLQRGVCVAGGTLVSGRMVSESRSTDVIRWAFRVPCKIHGGVYMH